ncbi:hypothetical protein AKO1_009145 [Acrasis kona]|uniref:Uncharacterized protein n=1 Tax=Acrasis kona TaxID=1008807 RepID=A0AAW2ZHZ2_9EUKA
MQSSPMTISTRHTTFGNILPTEDYSPTTFNIPDSPLGINNAYQRLHQQYLQQYIAALFLMPVATFIITLTSISIIGEGVTFTSYGVLVTAAITITVLQVLMYITVIILLVAVIVILILVTIQINLKNRQTEQDSPSSPQYDDEEIERFRNTRSRISVIISSLTCESLFVGPIMSRLESHLHNNLFCTIIIMLSVILSAFVVASITLNALILQLTGWLINGFVVKNFFSGIKTSLLMLVVAIVVILCGACVRLFCWKPSQPSAGYVSESDSYASEMINHLRQKFTPMTASDDDDNEGNDSDFE